MVRNETSVAIDAAPERVWAVLADVERWPEWTASMSRVQRLDEGDLAVGTRVRIKQPRLPAITWRVTELEPGRGFSWSATSPGVTTMADHRLTTLGQAVTVDLVIRRSGPLAGALNALSAGLTRRYLQMEADGLKRRCETA